MARTHPSRSAANRASAIRAMLPVRHTLAARCASQTLQAYKQARGLSAARGRIKGASLTHTRGRAKDISPIQQARLLHSKNGENEDHKLKDEREVGRIREEQNKRPPNRSGAPTITLAQDCLPSTTSRHDAAPHLQHMLRKQPLPAEGRYFAARHFRTVNGRPPGRMILVCNIA